MSWPWLVGGAITSMLAYANLPSRILLPAKAATEAFLASAKLQTLPSKTPVGNARELWSKSGAVIMAVRRPG